MLSQTCSRISHGVRLPARCSTCAGGGTRAVTIAPRCWRSCGQARITGEPEASHSSCSSMTRRSCRHGVGARRYKLPVSVLVVVHTPELEVLLLERADRPGFWQSVTGSQMEGETLEQTAVRELHEETGIDAGVYPLADWQKQNRYEIYAHWRHRYAPGVTHNTEHVFAVEVPDASASGSRPESISRTRGCRGARPRTGSSRGATRKRSASSRRGASAVTLEVGTWDPQYRRIAFWTAAPRRRDSARGE